MSKILVLVLLVASFFGWRVYRHQYVPIDVASVPAEKNTHGWKTYQNKSFGFEINSPANYLPCEQGQTKSIQPVNFDYILLRQNTFSAEDCISVGKRIGLYAYRLGRMSGFSLSGNTFKLTKETTISDIAHQFVVADNRPLVHRSCYQRNFNGNNAIICTNRAPGEMPEFTGDTFDVFVLAVYAMKNGERILVRVSNDAGGTPYTADHELQRDAIQIFSTLRFESQ